MDLFVGLGQLFLHLCNFELVLVPYLPFPLLVGNLQLILLPINVSEFPLPLLVQLCLTCKHMIPLILITVIDILPVVSQPAVVPLHFLDDVSEWLVLIIYFLVFGCILRLLVPGVDLLLPKLLQEFAVNTVYLWEFLPVELCLFPLHSLYIFRLADELVPLLCQLPHQVASLPLLLLDLRCGSLELPVQKGNPTLVVIILVLELVYLSQAPYHLCRLVLGYLLLALWWSFHSLLKLLYLCF